MRWRLILEEYRPELIYIKGEHNEVADELSRLPFDENLELKLNHLDMAKLFCLDEEDELEFPKDKYPLTHRYLYQAQQASKQLPKEVQKDPKHYKKEMFRHGRDQHKLVTYNGRIVVPGVALQ